MARSRQCDGAAIPAVLLAAVALLGWPAADAFAASPTPSVATSGPAGPERTPGALQRLIDGAAPSAVVVIPAGVYREAVVVDRPMTLRGEGAEIRGSDVWTAWRPEQQGWRSGASVPHFRGGGVCSEPRCAWPEQVFLDDKPLEQVALDPAPGQFSIDPDRRILLADDPTGRQVEVTVREHWLTVEAADVMVEGLVMRHAASPAQQGALQAQPGADRLIVSGVQLTDAHGALISFQGVTGASLVSSDLTRGGQIGVHAGGNGTNGLTIEGNRIAANNTEGFDSAWEAGGLKAALATDLRVANNDVADNRGPGIWCDIDCRDFTASGNRVHGNTGPGVMFEISDGAIVEDNVVWENGWGHPTWGWGAGILISSSTGAIVRNNVLAWNADGISVVSQVRNRAGGDAVRDTSVHDNTVISDLAGGYLLAWLQDWPGEMYAPGSDNTGSGNRFWHDAAEPTPCRFEWSGCRDLLADFARTPGGSGGIYLSADEAEAVLAGAGVQALPVPHAEGEPPRLRTVVLVAGSIGMTALALILAAVVLIRRRRRRL